MKMTLVHTVYRNVNFIRIQRKLMYSDSSYVETCGSKTVRKTPVEDEANSNAFLGPRSCCTCIARCRVPALSAIHYWLQQDQCHAKWWCTEGRGSRRLLLKFYPFHFLTHLVTLLRHFCLSPLSFFWHYDLQCRCQRHLFFGNSDEILITTLRSLSADDFCPPFPPLLGSSSQSSLSSAPQTSHPHVHRRYCISPLYCDIINRFIDICLLPSVSLQSLQQRTELFVQKLVCYWSATSLL